MQGPTEIHILKETRALAEDDKRTDHQRGQLTIFADSQAAVVRRGNEWDVRAGNLALSAIIAEHDAKDREHARQIAAKEKELADKAAELKDQKQTNAELWGELKEKGQVIKSLLAQHRSKQPPPNGEQTDDQPDADRPH